MSGRPEAPKVTVAPGGRIVTRDGRFYLDGATEVWRAVDAQGAPGAAAAAQVTEY